MTEIIMVEISLPKWSGFINCILMIAIYQLALLTFIIVLWPEFSKNCLH